MLRGLRLLIHFVPQPDVVPEWGVKLYSLTHSPCDAGGCTHRTNSCQKLAVLLCAQRIDCVDTILMQVQNMRRCTAVKRRCVLYANVMHRSRAAAGQLRLDYTMTRMLFSLVYLGCPGISTKKMDCNAGCRAGSTAAAVVEKVIHHNFVSSPSINRPGNSPAV